MPKSPRNILAATSVVLATVILLLIAVVRAGIVDAAYAPVVGCQACFIWPSIAHDLALLALVLAWLALMLSFSVRWLRVLMAVPLILFLVALIADIAVLKLLAQRLLVNDLIKFGHEIGAIERISRVGFAFKHVLIAASLLVATLTLAFTLRNAQRIPWRGTCGIVLLAMVVAAIGGWGRTQAPAYVHADAYRNWLEVNLAQSIDAPYSEAFLLRQQELPQPELVCSSGQARSPSIMLVMVESLSAYHSSLYVADSSYLPEFDALARNQGAWFSNFIANGFTTDGGMVATLSGHAPIPGFYRYASTDAFTGFEDARNGFTAAVEPAGYTTSFFTTGTLSFVDKQGWLPKVGFDHFEGAEAPFYKDLPRGIFAAADDPHLFARVLDWYQHERDTTRPFAAALLTVATHPPFVVRATRERDERAVFATLDRALVDFHQQLTSLGFFNDGILIVMGDHRSMTPLRAEEFRAYGESAFARTPLVVFGASGLPAGGHEALTQQTDLPAALRDLTRKESCREPQQGLWFRPQPVSAEYALHARGMPRSQIDLYRQDASFALQLAGDDSHWIGATPREGERIAARIHLNRAARAPNRDDLMTRLIEANAAAADHSIQTRDKSGQ